MIDLVFSAEDGKAILAELLGGSSERCAVLFAEQTRRADTTERLLVREAQFPVESDYSRQGVLEAELHPDFVARVTKRARREHLALVLAHSHPGKMPPEFSYVDNDGERHLKAFFDHRHPEKTPVALVVSAGGVRARRIGTEQLVRVIALGESREVLFDPTPAEASASEVFDRQVRAFGAAGQRVLERLRVAIVGLGGTGSIVAQQLVHLGVRDFILIDPDSVESTNLNRVANATRADVGRLKVDVAARYINAVASDVNARPIANDITRNRIAKELHNADLIFGCTDSHGSRAMLQQVSYQYLIPCIDMGSVIAVSGRAITHTYGRVQLLAPGQACFTCSKLLDAGEVRRDMMTAFERKADPYFIGAREPAPAVMSLNGTVASLAVTMMLSVVVGIPVSGRHLFYNARASTLRSARVPPDPHCFCCSRSGALGRADSWPLNGRTD